MRRLSVIAAAVIGLLFPLGLAFAVYLASASSLEEPADAAFSNAQTIARPTVSVAPATSAETTTEREDSRGRCDEPEHRSDPDCAGGTSTEDDSSGSGSGSGGSDSSGSGSGSDDSSGKGSGDDD